MHIKCQCQLTRGIKYHKLGSNMGSTRIRLTIVNYLWRYVKLFQTWDLQQNCESLFFSDPCSKSSATWKNIAHISYLKIIGGSVGHTPTNQRRMATFNNGKTYWPAERGLKILPAIRWYGRRENVCWCWYRRRQETSRYFQRKDPDGSHNSDIREHRENDQNIVFTNIYLICRILHDIVPRVHIVPDIRAQLFNCWFLARWGRFRVDLLNPNRYGNAKKEYDILDSFQSSHLFH